MSEARRYDSLSDWMDAFRPSFLSRLINKLRKTRSKSEIQDKITELTDRYFGAAEGLTLEESQSMRDISNGMTWALDWVIKEHKYL